MSGEMVDPALLPQLGHDGVDVGVAGSSLPPRGQVLGVAVPRNLVTYPVSWFGKFIV